MTATPSPLSTLPCDPATVDDFLSRPTPSVIEAVSRMDGDFMVLGAGGKMGLHVCLMLRKALNALNSPRRVVAVSRFGSVNERSQFDGAGVETEACDLCESAKLEMLPSTENVIFMAGAKFGTSGQPDLLHRMNVEMPERVANHFSSSRITAFSTGCVYSFVPVTSSGSSETAETDPIGEYAQSCLGRELAFRRSALEFQTALTLFRLNYSVEFRYGVLVDIAQKVFQDLAVDVTMGHVNVIWQRDAVARTLLAHEHASRAPFIINITGPEVLRVRDLAHRFGEIFGKTPKFEGTEAPTAWLNDASLSHKLFGEPETSLDEMIPWIAAWIATGQSTLGKPTGFEKRDGKF
jgi:nucleoside-diphosphate-sugar epimerase